MRIFRHTFAAFLAAVSIFSACASAAEGPAVMPSIFRMMFNDFVFMNIGQVLRAYEGDWSGSQDISVGGRAITREMVEQRYAAAVDDRMKLIGAGRITDSSGKTVSTRSVMTIEGDALRLEISGAGATEFYRGILEKNGVTWFPIYLFMSYDWQRDCFYDGEGGVVMISDGRRFIDIAAKNFMGFIDFHGEYFRADKPVSKPVDEKINKLFGAPKRGLGN